MKLIIFTTLCLLSTKAFSRTFSCDQVDGKNIAIEINQKSWSLANCSDTPGVGYKCNMTLKVGSLNIAGRGYMNDDTIEFDSVKFGLSWNGDERRGFFRAGVPGNVEAIKCLEI